MKESYYARRIFIRENDMGCGSMVYIDVTTGLIIGGQCFGD